MTNFARGPCQRAGSNNNDFLPIFDGSFEVLEQDKPSCFVLVYDHIEDNLEEVGKAQFKLKARIRKSLITDPDTDL